MRIGCHGLVWSGEFGPSGVRVAAEKTRAAGFDFVEFPLMDPGTFAVDEARAALEAFQLESTASLGLDADSDVSSEDPTRVARGAALLHRAVDVAAALGAPYVGGVIYSAMQKYMEPASAAGIRNSVRVIQDVADHAAELGISVGLEVVNRYESNVLNTGRQALAFVREVDRPNVVVHLDTYHMNIEESDPHSAVLSCGDRLGYFHIGENHRGYLGSGTIDFGSVFAALVAANYDGPIVFESFSSAVVSPSLSRMLGIWRELWTDNEELARHAAQTIRGQFLAAQRAS